MELALSREYDKPMCIVGNVFVKDGQTVFTYKGFAKSKNGEFTAIDETVIFDFVITENIRLAP